MKFLCMTCDEAFQHQATRGPEAGIMTIIFACPGCGWEMAMYTNPWETQAVRSLDVKIGGRSVPAEPLEMLRSSLGQSRDGLTAPAALAGTPPASGEVPTCPFADVVTQAYSEAQAAPASAPASVASHELRWTPEAEKRVEERIPSFVRAMARMGIEKYARERGYQEITPQVLDEAKEIFMG